jgi:hypothetical protein
MIPDVAWSLVPPDLPEDSEPWVELALSESDLTERERRATAWSHRFLRALAEGGPTGLVATLRVLMEKQSHRIDDISAGFIPVGRQDDPRGAGARRNLDSWLMHWFWTGPRQSPAADWVETPEGGWRFGVVIGIVPKVPSEETLHTPPDLSEMDRRIVERGRLATFPVLVEWRVIRGDAPPNPAGSATSACYARPRRGKHFYCGIRWTDGILIARHVLVPNYVSPGTKVPMSTGVPFQATVVEIDSKDTIDAAVLGISGSIPPTSAQLSLPTIVGSNAQVSVAGAVSQFKAKVLRVLEDPKYFGNLVTHRVFIDAHGRPGDSGALVTDNAGNAIGLYIGPDGISTEGIAQHMRQVVTYFDIDLYN